MNNKKKKLIYLSQVMLVVGILCLIGSYYGNVSADSYTVAANGIKALVAFGTTIVTASIVIAALAIMGWSDLN